MGGCRVCERMSDLSPQELAGAIVRDNVQRYIESRRGRIDAFVDRHFTLAGFVALHPRALGWDLLRARPICFSRGRRSPSSSWAGRRGGPAWSGWRHGLPAASSSSRPRSRARSSGWWQPNCSKYRADGGIGALWYGLFPATAGPGLLAATTAGLFLGGAMLAAFSGVVTDPLQRRMGLHRRRLEWLLRVLEADLLGEPGRNRLMRDHYVARLVDIFDLITLAMRVSHA
jgi:hypothetical protein